MYSAVGFSSAPTIHVSSRMTKIIIYGVVGNQPDASFFYVNYDGLQMTLIGFPYESILDPNNVRLILDEKWLYVRQMPSNLQPVSGGNQ